MYRLIIIEVENVEHENYHQIIQWSEVGFEFIRAFKDGSEAIEWLKLNTCDVVLTNVGVNQMNGLYLAAHVKEHFPYIKVVILSRYRDFEYIRQAMRYGVTDYLLKPVNKDELLFTFQSIKERIDAQLLSKPLKILEDAVAVDSQIDSNELVHLVKSYVSTHLSDGLNCSTIAEELCISPAHLSRLFKKQTGVKLSDYIIEKRMQLAMQMLYSENLPIGVISGKVGYYSASHFTRQFKAYTGYLPSVCIRMLRSRG